MARHWLFSFLQTRHESLRAYREEVIEPLLYFLLISRYLRTRTDLVRTLGAFIVAAVLAAAMGIIQGVFHITPDLLVVNADYVPRQWTVW